jgi:hypothetical protein
MPNVDWEAFKLEGIFEGDISKWTCDEEDDCVTRHKQKYLYQNFYLQK